MHNSLLNVRAFESFDTRRSNVQPRLMIPLVSAFTSRLPLSPLTGDFGKQKTLCFLWLDRLALSAATPPKLTNSKQDLDFLFCFDSLRRLI